MTTPPRQTQLQVPHQIRFDFAFNQVGNQPATTAALAAGVMNAGVQIGALPAGAIPVNANVFADVAFNNGTNNTISVGLTATGTDFVSGAAIGTKASVITAAPIAAIATVKAKATADGTPIFVSTSQTGTAATAGQASVIISYHPANG